MTSTIEIGTKIEFATLCGPSVETVFDIKTNRQGKKIYSSATHNGSLTNCLHFGYRGFGEDWLNDEQNARFWRVVA